VERQLVSELGVRRTYQQTIYLPGLKQAEFKTHFVCATGFMAVPNLISV
jgi:hypothetical protein